jgi:hypothetical protein
MTTGFLLLLGGFAVYELVRVAGTGCLSSACLTRHDVCLDNAQTEDCCHLNCFIRSLLGQLATRPKKLRTPPKSKTAKEIPEDPETQLSPGYLWQIYSLQSLTLVGVVLTTHPWRIVLVPILQCASTLTTGDIWAENAYFVI